MSSEYFVYSSTKMPGASQSTSRDFVLASIDEASIISAQYCPQSVSAEQLWSQSLSTNGPYVSPLLEPALLSPRTHAQVSPFLRPGAADWQFNENDVPSLEQVDRASRHISPICKHDLSIPCAEQGDENEVERFGAKNVEPVGLNGWPNGCPTGWPVD